MIKITSSNPKKIVELLKKGICTVGLAATLVTGLTGCNGESIVNYARTEDPYQTDTSYSAYLQDITEEDLYELPETMEEFCLRQCYYVTDLSYLPDLYPNLKRVYILDCNAISDYSFLYKLDKLEEVRIEESPFITQDLIQYLDRRGIKHNLDYQDIKNCLDTDRIISEIISDDMSDEEKIKAVIYYIRDNYKYDAGLADDSNYKPLTTMLTHNKGVCASYASLTQALLLKANVTSYEIFNDTHAWNIIKLDDKYYYMDTTNALQVPLLSRLSVELFGVAENYLADPNHSFMAATSPYDSDKVLIPDSLIEDIQKGEDEKTLIERYGNSIPTKAIAALIVIVGISLGVKACKAIAENKRRNRRRRF